MLGTGKKDRRQPTRAVAASSVVASSEYVSKRIRRHLNDLERTNYTEPSAGISKITGDDDDEEPRDSGLESKEEGAARSRKKQGSKAVRQLLLYRKNLGQLIDESGLPDPTSSEKVTNPSYLTIASEPSKRPPVQMCSVCGYKGKYSCKKCGNRYCDLGCQVTHDESRCERR
ncbi:Hit1p [Sporobolomyces salmoneus]|uniref:Hit1p n=1 Tax=Sporobolomyces salmoneus TaxID=183962 RepID=UPI00316D5BA2